MSSNLVPPSSGRVPLTTSGPSTVMPIFSNADSTSPSRAIEARTPSPCSTISFGGQPSGSVGHRISVKYACVGASTESHGWSILALANVTAIVGSVQSKGTSHDSCLSDRPLSWPDATKVDVCPIDACRNSTSASGAGEVRIPRRAAGAGEQLRPAAHGDGRRLRRRGARCRGEIEAQVGERDVPPGVERRGADRPEERRGADVVGDLEAERRRRRSARTRGADRDRAGHGVGCRADVERGGHRHRHVDALRRLGDLRCHLERRQVEPAEPGQVVDAAHRRARA